MIEPEETESGSELPIPDPRRWVSLPLRHTWGAVLGVLISVAGCASLQQQVGGWFGAATPTPTSAARPGPAAAAGPRLYYAGAEGVQVYRDPSTSSQVLGKLALHEKVTRFKLERGYAYVEGTTSSVKGWVNNAQLIWRLPGGATTSAPATMGVEPEEPAAAEPEEPEAAAPEEPQEPQAPEATATATEALPTPLPTMTPRPAAPPKAKTTPGGVAPSIFNPY